MPNIVNIGIVGTGDQAENHLKALQLLEERPAEGVGPVKVVGVFDIRLGVAVSVAQRYGVKPYDSLAALGADCDVLVNVTGNAAHLPVALEALDYADLVTEKPIAVSLTGCDQIRQKAEQLRRTVRAAYGLAGPARLAARDRTQWGARTDPLRQPPVLVRRRDARRGEEGLVGQGPRWVEQGPHRPHQGGPDEPARRQPDRRLRRDGQSGRCRSVGLGVPGGRDHHGTDALRRRAPGRTVRQPLRRRTAAEEEAVDQPLRGARLARDQALRRGRHPPLQASPPGWTGRSRCSARRRSPTSRASRRCTATWCGPVWVSSR